MESKLRNNAINILNHRKPEVDQKTPEEIIHELQVHQIELELQNEELRLSQEKLLISQQRYFDLFELAPVAYIIVDSNTKIIDLNLTATQIFKLEKIKLTCKRFNSFIHPEYQDDFYFFFKELPNQNHETCLLIDNSKVYVRIACNKDRNQAEGSCYRLTVMDITTEKLARMELEMIKERLELSLLSGKVAWWVWDYPSQAVYYDKMKAEMLGYKENEMSKNIYEITAMIHPEDYEHSMNAMRDHLQGKTSWYRVEYRLKTKEGKYKWLYDQGSVTQRDQQGKPLKICGVVIDIDERKTAELKHKESERKFRQFASLLPQMVCELDGDFNILYMNEYGKKLLQIESPEIPNLLNYFDNQNQKHVSALFQEKNNLYALKRKGINLTLQDPQGNPVQLVAFASIESSDGKINTIRLLGIDLTERIKLEEQLNLLNSELNDQKEQLEKFNLVLEQKVKDEVEKNRVKDQILLLQDRHATMGEMIGHIAHQWKQPLSTLNLIVLDLLDSFEHNELTKEYISHSVSTAINVIQHMNHTVDDFRNFFRPLNTRIRFNITEQVEKAVSLIRHTLDNEGIRLNINLTTDVYSIGFPNEFSQVVINIVNNAREAIIESMKINPEISIHLISDDHRLYLYFSNNGGSIDEKILPMVFEPYFTTKEAQKGTGIGLYLARTIINQNMSGEIGVKNINGGVEFEIILPIS
jgi:PAS domain S-box-containing protein